MSFSGFPEEAQTKEQGAVPRKVTGGGGGSRRARERLLLAAEKKTDDVVACSLPQEARLSAPAPPSTPVKLRISENGRCDVIEGADPPPSPEIPNGAAVPEVKKDDILQEEAPKDATPRKENPQDEQPSKASSSSKLEMFQEKQKFIEEQNRQRKEILSKVILDRQKQTDQESRKLVIVQAELAKIDTLLNTDVHFLRESIEQASFEFMKAQKRYDDAEKEFIASKLHLFELSERKELLTDHLCSIIEQNEQRKAKRLNELMDELELEGPAAPEPQEETQSLKELRPAAVEFNTLKPKAETPENGDN